MFSMHDHGAMKHLTVENVTVSHFCNTITLEFTIMILLQDLPVLGGRVVPHARLPSPLT